MARSRKGTTRTAKQATPHHDAASDAEMKHPFAAVLVVLALVVAFTVIAYQAFIVGKLFVKVSVHDGQPTDPVLVCVYQGDQTDALASSRTVNAPQAEAALTVQPGVETRIYGSWHGQYTVEVVDPQGLAKSSENIQTTYVSRGETHVGFSIDRALPSAQTAGAGGATGTAADAA